VEQWPGEFSDPDASSGALPIAGIADHRRPPPAA
jgi:hypothetical protein